MPGDTTVLMAKTGRTLSYEDVKESFDAVRKTDRIVSMTFPPNYHLIQSLEAEIKLLRVLNNILSNRR